MLLFLSQVHPKGRDTTPRNLCSPSTRLRAECGKTQRPLRAVLSRCCSIPLGALGALGHSTPPAPSPTRPRDTDPCQPVSG